MKRIFVVTLLFTLGGLATYFLVPLEKQLVNEFLNNNPESDSTYYRLRAPLLVACLLFPAIGAVFYNFLGILDRYLVRKLLSVFTICLSGFTLIWLLLEIQNAHSDFSEGTEFKFILLYYVIQIPYLLVLMSPFVLLLSSLFVLGQLSTHREVVSMIQTGRGLLRVVAPIIGFGVYMSIFLTLLNFHWAPWGESQKDAIKNIAKYDSYTKAENLISCHEVSGRLWFVGLFPQDFYGGKPLKNIEITFLSDDNFPSKRMRAEEAYWDKDSGDWTFKGVSEIILNGKDVPRFSLREEVRIEKGWPETPSQLVTPELEAESLGLAELFDWVKQYSGKAWLDKMPYLTQIHSRIAKPWSCLVAVLLASPLGVVYSRKGAMGGMVIALILCILLFFFTEILTATGSSGYVKPWIAAWGGNLLFTAVAVILLIRRMQNRPVYQSIAAFFSLLGGKDS